MIINRQRVKIQISTCALITLDESGHPQARTMDPFSPDEDLAVWLGTNSKSRKVKEIKMDPRVTLYYQAEHRRCSIFVEKG